MKWQLLLDPNHNREVQDKIRKLTPTLNSHQVVWLRKKFWWRVSKSGHTRKEYEEMYDDVVKFIDELPVYNHVRTLWDEIILNMLNDALAIQETRK